MKPYSITHRLIAIVLLIELASALCVTTLAFIYERHAHFRSFEVMLRGRADSLLGAVQDADDADDNVMLDGSEMSLPRSDIYEVTEVGGHVLGRSQRWVDESLLPRPGEGEHHHGHDHGDDHGHGGNHAGDHDNQQGKAEFFNTTLDGEHYRMLRLDGVRVVDPGEKGGGVRRPVTILYGSPVSRVWGDIRQVVFFYAASSLAVLAITGLLMSWLLNRGLAPLRQLAAGAAQVSAVSWAFEPPESARQSKELSPLVVAMEELLLGLKAAFERQRRFAGDAAHELKTSVAVVKSSVQLLQIKKRTAEEYEAGLERCLKDCERMEQIVAQMLTLARVEEISGNRSAPFETDLRICLDQVIAQLSTMAEVVGVSIVIASEETIAVDADPELVTLLSMNVLMNALQHSSRGTAITVHISKPGAFALIEFIDQGEGISPEMLPYIFERFSRSDPSRSRKTGGTGLGLAIAKGIADGCGGSILIKSELNRGTMVLVELPLSKPQP